MKLLGLDHIGIVVRDISETVARAGDTVDGRAVGERILAGDIDLQFLLFGETRLELIEVRAAGAVILPADRASPRACNLAPAPRRYKQTSPSSGFQLGG